MSDKPAASQNDAVASGHEPDAVNARMAILSSSGLVLLVALVLLLMYGTIRFLAGDEQAANGRPPLVQRMPPATGPQVTSDQPRLLRELRQSEQQQLTTYGWIDQDAGIARIPIDRAMDILAERGLPTQDQRGEEQDDDESR